MNEISLIFYGDRREVEHHLLVQLNLLKVLPSIENRSGFYINESRFGRDSLKKISLDIESGDAETILIYRYLSEKELSTLKNAVSGKKYYILPHKMFDLIYIKSKIMNLLPQAYVVTDLSEGSSLRSGRLVKSRLAPKNIVNMKSVGANHKSGDGQKSGARLPVLLLFLFKIFINPISELRRLSILIKYSNLRWISRILELVFAIEFVVNAVVIKHAKLLLIHTYYKSNYLRGVLKVVVIRAGFAFRHLILMSGFKSYGFFVDKYYQVIKPTQKFVIYRVAYFLYYRVLYFLFFNVFYFLYSQIRLALILFYYRVLYFLFFNVFYFLYSQIRLALILFYYRVLYFLYNRIRMGLILFYYRVLYFLFYTIFNFFRFQVRHFILISAFKIYGWMYDSALFLYRVTKLWLLYPVFKIYWFLAFQYKKRIKKVKLL